MELLEDGAIAFLSAVGLAACVWLIAGAFFPGARCTNPKIMLLLPVRGNAPAMEADFRELLRVRRSLPNARVILMDCGLNPESRDLAEYFQARYQRVEVCSPETLKVE